MTHHASVVALERASQRSWWWEWESAALGILVLVIYFARLTTVPVCGEESRWASAAREMIVTGDWIVPRQQGEIFPERPPLSIWAMALAGLGRGDVDLVAIRLPSVCAVLATVWIIYAYARLWMSRLASFSAAAIFATFGHVMAIGRFGESEAVFTLFTAAALLAWHAGYLQRWPAVACWTVGYALAALGALTKGSQPPVYFVSVCCVFLAYQRNWRFLFCRGHLAGMGVFALIVGVWFVPFAVTNPASVDDIWMGLAQDRFTRHGFLKHLATYPVELLGCLLPWSPLLIPLVKPSVWRAMLKDRPEVRFLLTALVVTFPSVWLASGARGRYFMPLYPCLAILMGLMVEHCTRWDARLADRLIWRRVLRAIGAASLISVAAVAVASFGHVERLEVIRQPSAYAIVWIVAGLTGTAVLAWASLGEQAVRPAVAIVCVSALFGLAHTGLIINARLHGANDLSAPLVQVKHYVEDTTPLVSLGSVYHRFAYCYDAPIPQVPWPLTAEELPGELEYFCFDRRAGDTAQVRTTGDGRSSRPVPGTLPFEWEKVTEIPCDPVARAQPHRSVIIGRVRRGERMAAPPASRPERR